MYRFLGIRIWLCLKTQCCPDFSNAISVFMLAPSFFDSAGDCGQIGRSLASAAWCQNPGHDLRRTHRDILDLTRNAAHGGINQRFPNKDRMGVFLLGEQRHTDRSETHSNPDTYFLCWPALYLIGWSDRMPNSFLAEFQES